MGLFNKNSKRNSAPITMRTEMFTTSDSGYFAWNGKIYDSDIIRAAIRPKVNAIGKLDIQHIYEHTDENGKTVFEKNPKPYMRFLLMRPNPYMSMQKFLEKMETWKIINNNAFALITRDENGFPIELYPIPAVQAEAIFDKGNRLFIRFLLQNGKQYTFPYTDLIHLKRDYNTSDIFGDNNVEALSQLMEIVGTTDQGIVKAIKNSGIIRWLIKYPTPLGDKKIKQNVQNFVNNYLSVESETFGAAGIDSSGDIKQIEPKDFVPNAAQMDRSKERIYSYFNTNEAIVQNKWNEDEYNAYYEGEIEPDIIDIQNELTYGLFSRREIGCGNYIYAEAFNLESASLKTKLQLIGAMDRGALLINEFRRTLKLSPVPWGDTPIRRLDTAEVTSEGGETENED